jgi:hypothetical protein
MAKRKDITNMKFGKLTALKPTNKKHRGNYLWECKCECGNKTEVTVVSLNSGNTKSCGCMFKFSWGQAALNTLYREYSRSAKKRGYSFELTKEEFEQLTEKNCVYCKVQPSQYYGHKEQHGEYIYNGIDRVDNSKGYVLGNCVPCCGTCNMAKRDLPIDDFLKWLERYKINTSTLKERIRIETDIQLGIHVAPVYHKTVRVIDVDGTVLGKVSPDKYQDAELLPGAVEKINNWYNNGDYILFWTARPKSLRIFTRWQLTRHGFRFHQLRTNKPYSREIHIYDDNPIYSHRVTRDKGIGMMKDEELEEEETGKVTMKMFLDIQATEIRRLRELLKRNEPNHSTYKGFTCF